MICQYCGTETEPTHRYHERGDCPPTACFNCDHDVADHFMGACLVSPCHCKRFITEEQLKRYGATPQQLRLLRASQRVIREGTAMLEALE